MENNVESMVREMLSMMSMMSKRVEALESGSAGSMGKNGEERTAGPALQVGCVAAKKKSDSEGVGSVSTEESGVEPAGSVASWSDEMDRVSSSDAAPAAASEGLTPVAGLPGSHGVGDSVERSGGVSVSGISSDGSSEAKNSDEENVKLPVAVKTLGISFGGVDDLGVVKEVHPRTYEPGAYATYVRNHRVVALKSWIKKHVGVNIPSKSMKQLALATYTAGCVPEFFERGKDELKTLAVVGDAAMTLAVARYSYGVGSSSESTQVLRSTALSDTVMKQKLFSSGLNHFIIAPTGVNLAVSKSGATALEAIAGAIELSVVTDRDAVYKFVKAVGLI